MARSNSVMYRREKKYADWERSKIIQKNKQLPPRAGLKLIHEDLVHFLESSLDKECCLFLNPQLDLYHKGGREVAIILELLEEFISIDDVVRFIHAIIVGKYLSQLNTQKPCSIIVNGKKENGKAYQRVFEVMNIPKKQGKMREGCSILRTVGLGQAGVIDVLVQPIYEEAKGINADNFAYQFSVLSNGREAALLISKELIEGDIFLSLLEKEHSNIAFDEVDLRRFFIGVILFALLMCGIIAVI